LEVTLARLLQLPVFITEGATMRSREVNESERTERRAAGWVWWGILAACLAIGILAVSGALWRGNVGGDRNRGPATEAAPNQEPARDIDRSRAP
jgi:hypothetical protein